MSEYVLRERDDEELHRLKFQHRIWKAETDFAIKQAGICEGETIIDLGSGPGYVSYDLLYHVGKSGTLYCMDNSEKFITFIKNRNIPNIVPVMLDIRNDLPKYTHLFGKIDTIFSRWLLLFTGHAERIIGEIYELLKPGGKFISMEYFDFNRMAVSPHSDSFEKIFRNVGKLIAKNGGVPDIGNDIRSIMQAKGFRNTVTFPVYKTGKANSPVWEWITLTNANHKNLVEAGLIRPEDLEAFHTDWNERSENRSAYVTAPPLMITIGEK